MDKKAKLQWVIEAEPGETAPPMSEAEAAKARGYHIVMSDLAPEPTKDGLPTIWVQGNPQDAIPVIPTRPAFHPATRTVIIPEVAGVQYWLDGNKVQPGPVKVPGEGFTKYTVSATALDGYVATGKYEWIQVIGSIEGRELWVSDDPSLRPAGQELTPPAPGTSSVDDNGKYGHYKPRQGEKMNNAFGGYGEAHFYQLGAGWARGRNETASTRASWKISDHGTYIEQHRDTITMVFPQTRNLSFEFDFVPSKSDPRQAAQFWIGAIGGLYMTDAGYMLVGRTKDGAKDVLAIPENERAGTWRVDIVDDVYTVTTPRTEQYPQGRKAVQDWSEFNGKDGTGATGLIGFRLNTAECKGIRIYKRKDEGVNVA